MITTDRLSHGDYVEGLTEDQFNELISIENHHYKLSYVNILIATIDVNNGLCLTGFNRYARAITLHDFPTFKQKCINTFQL